MKTILVADDQPLMRLVVRAMLDSNPAYQVHEVENGAEATVHDPFVTILARRKVRARVERWAKTG